MAYTYPQPILNNTDEILGNFNPNWDSEIINDHKTLSIKTLDLGIENTYIQGLIEKGIAHVAVRIFCSSSLFSWSQKVDIKNTILIPMNELDGVIDIKYLIVCSHEFENYTDSSFNDIYNETTFKVNKNDIIGVSPSYILNIHELYESKQKNMFRMIPDPDVNYIHYNFNADQITINYPCQKSNKIPVFHKRFNKLSKSNLVLSFFYPCFIELFHTLQKSDNDDEGGDDLRNYQWYQKLIGMIGDKDWEDINPTEIAWNVVNTYKNILESAYKELK